MDKIYGRYTRAEIRGIYASFHQTKSLLEQSRAELLLHLDIVNSWSDWYERPFEELLAEKERLFSEVSATETGAQKAERRSQQLSEVIAGAATPDYVAFPSDQHLINAIRIQIAYGFQMKAMGVFSESLSSLFQKVRGGDDSALFEAVTIDYSVISAPTVANRVAKAIVKNDVDFRTALTKAILGIKPRRPDPKYDDLRYMIEVLQENLDEPLNARELSDILVQDLELYPDDSDYSLRTFQRLIRKRNNRHDPEKAFSVS